MGRVVIVWMVVILSTFLLMGLWYVTQPWLVGFAHTVGDILIANGWDTSQSDTALTLFEWVINIFYVGLIGGLWFWGANEAQRKDYRGYYG